MLILQPTPFCNVDCSYCYLPNRTDRQRMSWAVLDAAFAKILPSRLPGDRLSVVWHAGEPLVLPPAWYEDAFARAERHRPDTLTIRHVFQTNGTLVNENWAAFFKHTGAHVSFSLDGPAWLHDRKRRTRTGQGTHSRAMAGLQTLQNAAIWPSVITVLTRDSLEHPDALFDFYRESAITDVAFNVEETEGANMASTMRGTSTQAAYRQFLDRFFQRMHASPGTLNLREWRDAVDVLRYGVEDGFNQESEPLRIISIAADGSVSSFSPELLGMQDERYGDFVFGNILTDSLDTIAARVKSSTLHAHVAQGVANCRRTCGWFRWCGGGSPSNKIFETGEFRSTETEYCRLTRQTVLDAVLATLEWQQGIRTGVAA